MPYDHATRDCGLLQTCPAARRSSTRFSKGQIGSNCALFDGAVPPSSSLPLVPAENFRIQPLGIQPDTAAEKVQCLRSARTVQYEPARALPGPDRASNPAE